MRQALQGGLDTSASAEAGTQDGEQAAPVAAAKPTLKAKRIKAGSETAAEAQAAPVPDAPF